MLRFAMRSYVVVALIAALGLAGYLGYRQVVLERRVNELSRELGAAQSGGDTVQAQAPKDSGGDRPSAVAQSYADRVRALEVTVAQLRADFRSLEKATADMPEQGASDQQILNVMKEQGAKAVEKQLSYHRERWLDQRELALNSFAQRFNLNRAQQDQLWGLLSSEIDHMVDLLKKPESYEDPERYANEWKTMLLETDAAAHRVLDRDKSIAWDQQRALERKILWPWLPE
jgi:hypothetical protein